MNVKENFPTTVGKETIRKVVETAYGRLTRVGGWGIAGGKKAALDIIKKGIQQLTK